MDTPCSDSDLYQSQTRERTVSALKTITLWHCWFWGAEHRIAAVTFNVQNEMIYVYRGDRLVLIRRTVASAKSTRSRQISPDRPSVNIRQLLKTDSRKCQHPPQCFLCCRMWLEGFFAAAIWSSVFISLDAFGATAGTRSWYLYIHVGESAQNGMSRRRNEAGGQNDFARNLSEHQCGACAALQCSTHPEICRPGWWPTWTGPPPHSSMLSNQRQLSGHSSSLGQGTTSQVISCVFRS